MKLCKAALRFHRRLTPQLLLTLDPSPLHLGRFIMTAVTQPQIDVNDGFVALQGCG